MTSTSWHHPYSWYLGWHTCYGIWSGGHGDSDTNDGLLPSWMSNRLHWISAYLPPCFGIKRVTGSACFLTEWSLTLTISWANIPQDPADKWMTKKWSGYQCERDGSPGDIHAYARIYTNPPFFHKRSLGDSGVWFPPIDVDPSYLSADRSTFESTCSSHPLFQDRLLFDLYRRYETGKRSEYQPFQPC